MMKLALAALLTAATCTPSPAPVPQPVPTSVGGSTQTPPVPQAGGPQVTPSPTSAACQQAYEHLLGLGCPPAAGLAWGQHDCEQLSQGVVDCISGSQACVNARSCGGL